MTLLGRIIRKTPLEPFARRMTFKPDANDKLTIEIMSRVLRKESNCLDIGANFGNILAYMTKFAPEGQHMAVEPIPDLCNSLRKHKNVEVVNCALGNSRDEITFNYIVNSPGLSGVKERDLSPYLHEGPIVRKMTVRQERLDDIYPSDRKLDFVKIDTEGSEYNILSGAIKTIKRNHPLIIFEFGIRAAKYFNVTPSDIFRLITEELGLQIFSLEGYLNKRQAMALQDLEQHYNNRSLVYFAAH